MIIGLDFECFYTAAYSLKKISTEAYIRHPFFEVIGCSISINGAPSTWYPQPEVSAALNTINWSTTSLLCFNTLFDGAILAWVYGHYPRFYLDAMGMARALGKAYRGGSLGKVLATCELGHKGDYVKQAINKRYADFTPAQLQEYGEYCCNDTDQTVALYKQLQPSFPDSEALIQDMNLRLFIEPTLHFDTDILQLHRADVIENKRQQLLKASELLDLPLKDTEEELIEQLRKILSSNEKFAALLISLGVDPPTKISPSNGKEIWAFAKTDPDFMELEEHEDPAVQALVAARVGTRSTIEETRAESFLDLATRGPIPVQYNYYGGHPGRFSGGGNCNFQNLKRGGKLRDAIIAPPGHFVITGDLSQIEARLVNYLAGQDDVVEAFRLHDIDPDLYPDVYCILAGKLFGHVVTRQDKIKRQSGKVGELSLGFGGGWKAYKRGMYKESGIVVSQGNAQQVVDIYRDSHKRVQGLWREGDNALHCLKKNVPFEFGRKGILDGSTPEKGIGLPNGLYITYPELRQEWDEKEKSTNWYYTTSKRGTVIKKKIYGSVAVQNMIEGLGRIILTDAWIRIERRGLRIVLHCHDELAGIVPYADIEKAKVILQEELTKPVSWAPGLPIMCEIKYGQSYGNVK